MSTFSHIVDHATELHMTEFGPHAEPNMTFSESLQRTVSNNSSQDPGEGPGGGDASPTVGTKRPKPRFKGVFRCGKKFKAQIQTHGVQHYLGLFDSEEEAARAYDAHARLVLGMKAKTNFEYNPRDVTTSQQPSAPSVTASSQNAGNSGDEGAQAKSRHTGRAYVGVKLKKREWMTSASEAPSLPIPPMIPPKSLITASMINGAHNPAAAANALLHLNQLTSGAFMMPHGIPIQPMHMLPHIPPLLPPIDPHSTTAALHTMNLPLPPVSHASTLPAMSTHVGQGSSGDWSKHPYTPLEISPPPAYHPVAAVNEPDWRDQIYYWVGQLRFDEKGKCLVWEGKWMGSFTGKPPKEELESSTNDFSYKSVEVSKSSVMQGTGGLVPYSGLYHGYHLIDTEGEEAEVEREKFEEKDVLIEFEEVAGGHSATHQACGRGESEFGVFILNGSYVCTTGILEMSRQYLADHDLRCTMTIAQLKQYFKATGGRP